MAFNASELASETQVTDFGRAVMCHKHVCWLEISVHDIGRVDIFEPAEKIVHDRLDMPL